MTPQTHQTFPLPNVTIIRYILAITEQVLTIHPVYSSSINLSVCVRYGFLATTKPLKQQIYVHNDSPIVI